MVNSKDTKNDKNAMASEANKDKESLHIKKKNDKEVSEFAKDDEENLSEQDLKLKNDLDMLVNNLLSTTADSGDIVQLYLTSMQSLKDLIMNSTSSMTAVPKPLKFLRNYYNVLLNLYYNVWSTNNSSSNLGIDSINTLRSKLSDILSVISMTFQNDNCLKFRLLSNESDFEKWGHEYIRHLALQIGIEYNKQNIDVVLNKDSEKNDTTVETGNKELETAKTDNNENDNDKSNTKEEENKELSNSSTEEFTIPPIELESEKDIFNNDNLVSLALEIIPLFIRHNGEEDAVDLLLEIEKIDKLPEFIDELTYKRICQYMIACVPLLPTPDDLAFLNVVFTIYLNHNQFTDAILIAIRLNNEELIRLVFDSTDDLIIKKQLAYILSNQKVTIFLDPESDKELIEIMGNIKLSEHFKFLINELNLTEPKLPEDVYKSHLDNSKSSAFNSQGLDSAQQNLASSLVNGLLNMGYSKDKLILDNDTWIYKTKNDGMTSAVASIGSIFQWDLDGLQHLDKYVYVDEVEVKAGALLGIGVAATGIHDNDIEPALLLLQDYVSNSNPKISSAAILALGIAFAGNQNEDVLDLLLPLISNTSLPIETSAMASLALSHVFVGTSNNDITTSIVDNFLERTVTDLKSEWVKFFALALGLLYLGQGDQADIVIETFSTLDQPMTSAIEVLVNCCAYCGTGDVLLIQDLLHRLTPKKMTNDASDDEVDEDLENADAMKTFLGDSNEEDKMDIDDENNNNNSNSNEDAINEDTGSSTTEPAEKAKTEKTETEISTEKEKKENEEDADDRTEAEKKEDEEAKENGDIDELSFAVLGIALIAIGEDIGKEMSLRHFGHLMHYGNEHIRRMVPLSMGLVSIADPQMKVFDALTRFSHDSDLDISMNSIFAMGLCGVGTNNARLAQLLRQIASYYSREQDALFITRLAQGLLHLGKGTLTMDVYNDSHVLNKVSLASLLTVLVGMSSPSFMLQHHQLFFFLNSGVRPKYIITVNEDGEPIKVNVRVGQAVETVGQAGKPKTITGWITQSTPVLLGHGERAELENDEYISYTNNLEGIVILKKNPDYDAEE